MLVTTTESLSATRDLGRNTKMIYQLVHKFHQRNGGDFDELLGEAHLAYVEARNNFNPERGVKFITYLHCIVRGRLKDWGRRREVDRKMTRESLSEHISERRNCIDTIERECSPDANLAMRFALDPPIDVVMIARNIRSENRPLSLRQAIEIHLAELGWAVSRIWHAFSEIQEVLT